LDPVATKIVSSEKGLRIAELVSERPRSLNELSELTGISVQGVLKHVRKLESLGFAEARKLEGRTFGVRVAYSAKDLRVEDFSSDGLTVLKVSRNLPWKGESATPLKELELLSEETLLQRRRIGEQTRKLGRLIEDLVEDENRFAGTLEAMDLGVEERLILWTLFTEDTREDAERVLLKHFGLRGGRRSIDNALSKARQIAKK
jgi:biotin operon repressor